VQNTGSEFYSNLGVKIYSAAQPNIFQYIGYGVVCIPAGETKTFNFTGTITCATGSYYAVAVYDSTNSCSSMDFKVMGPTAYEPVAVTVLPEPSTPALSLSGNIYLPNGNTVYRNQNITLNTTISNTGGYFDSDIVAFVFQNLNSSSIDYLNPKTIYIDTDQSQNIALTGSLDLDPGNYTFALFYKNPNGWNQMTPYDSGMLNFTLVDSGTDLSNTHSSGFSIYPNPVVDELRIKTEETIGKVQILDISGRPLLEIIGDSNLQVGDLKPGLYVLRIETERGTMTGKFIKK
jgi:hypothetical protein